MEGKILGVFPAERRSDTQEAGGRSKEQTHISGEENIEENPQEREARNEKLEERIGAFSTSLLANPKGDCVYCFFGTFQRKLPVVSLA